MSKTLGNVIDPLDTIKEYGTDALRFTISLGTAGQVRCPFYNFFFYLFCECGFHQKKISFFFTCYPTLFLTGSESFYGETVIKQGLHQQVMECRQVHLTKYS